MRYSWSFRKQILAEPSVKVHFQKILSNPGGPDLQLRRAAVGWGTFGAVAPFLGQIAPILGWAAAFPRAAAAAGAAAVSPAASQLCVLEPGGSGSAALTGIP